MYYELYPYFHSFKVWLPLLAILGFFYWLIWRRVENLQHWQHSFDGLEFSAEEFYTSVQDAIQKREIPDIHFSRITLSQNRTFGDSREYLHIEKNEFVYDVCAAPFGNGFFVSLWYVERPPFFTKFLHALPKFKAWIEQKTYYQVDTDGMIKGAIQAGFSEAVEALSNTKGVRALTDAERAIKF